MHDRRAKERQYARDGSNLQDDGRPTQDKLRKGFWLRILMNSNADSDPFRTLISIFFERRLRSFLNSSERSNGAWNHHA